MKFTAIFQKCQVGADAQGLFLCLPLESDIPETRDTPKRNIRNCFWEKSAVIPELRTHSVL